MIFPSISDLTKDKYNRYELVIATAKCARMITDEYVKERETAERMAQGNKEMDKAVYAMIKRERPNTSKALQANSAPRGRWLSPP